MRKISLLILAAFCISSAVYSQRWKLKRYEAVIGIGTTNIFSDLGGRVDASMLFIEDITFRDTRPSIYTGVRYKINQQSSAKLALIYGYGKTEDFDGSRNDHRQFLAKTHLVELSAHYEYYLIQETKRYRSAAMFNRRGMLNNYSTISLYVFGGIGLTKYWTTLESEPRPTDTYDDRNKFIPSFPLGIGLKYIISDKWIIGYEIGGRYTFCDYIDGFKPSASKHNDIYWLSTFNLNYRIKTSRRGLPLFLDRYRVRVRRR
ncbi:MAG: outer membrane beta-barrel protein [Bacteroidales bacterium]|nr:MAG: outer membrane beta-barrel protein [Bacteroidales bacterium]